MTNDMGPDTRSGTAEVAKGVALLLDLAIRRTRANVHADEEVKDFICRVLQKGKRQVLLAEERRDRLGLEIVHGGREVDGLQLGGTSG